jgi:predicted DCC family thiol-disulfide oxidoreductase YuxK
VAKVKVYYNGACPVCNAGIKGQRERMSGCSAEVDWIDIHSHPDAVREINAEQEFVRERLHVVDEQGTLHVGADAFGALWTRTPEQKALGRLISSPVLRVLSRWLYNGFAALLYAWNKAHRRW